MGRWGGDFSRRRGWQRTVGGCGWSRLWPRHPSRFLLASLRRCWSATGICCCSEESRRKGQMNSWSFSKVDLNCWRGCEHVRADLLELWRLFLSSGPGGGWDGTGLEGLTGRRGGWACSLRWTLSRLGRRGRRRAVSPCHRTDNLHVSCLTLTASPLFAGIKYEKVTPTSSWLGGLEEKKKSH